MSIEAEISIIGSLLKNNESYDLLPGDFHASDFFREDHQTIYQTIQSMLDAGKPVDVLLLAEALDSRRSLEKVGGLKYLGEIADNTFTYKNIAHYAGIVHKSAILRNLKAAANEIVNLCESSKNPIDIAIEAEKKITDILDNKAKADYVHISVAVSEAFQWEKTELKTIKSGLRDLDDLTGGFANGNLIIVAARPSMGKSALCMQIAETPAKRHSVAIFSLEMTRREIAARMIKYHRSVMPNDNLVNDHLFRLNMQFDETGSMSLGHIRTMCRRIKRKHGLEMVVIDYLQLMTGEGENRNQEVGAISRGLKSIAKEFDIPVIALSQLSRKVDDRTDRRPIMSDLRDSGEIEQDADMILFIYRDEVYNQDSPAKGTAEIICRKNRNGGVGTRRLTFNGLLTRFGNYDGGEIRENAYKRAKEGFCVER